MHGGERGKGRPDILCNDPKISGLIWQIYQQSNVGCCLHITLDDGNIEDTHIDFCMENAIKNKHSICLELAQKLKGLSRHARAYVLGMRWCPSCKDYSQYKYCGMGCCDRETVVLTPDIKDLFPHIF